MKRLTFKLTASLVGALFAGTFGCTNLEDKLLDTKTGDAAAGNATLSGVYSQLNSMTNQANVYAMQEHTTDEQLGPTRGTDWSDFGTWRQLHQHSWNSTHNQIIDAWNDMHTGVFRATQVLAQADVSTSAAAEARFLRAMFMFQLVDLFGQVPFREANEGFDVNPKVFTRQQATDFILADLDFAVQNLPAGKQPLASPTKATRDAAIFLRAKAKLNRAVYNQDPTKPSGPFTFAAEDMNQVIADCDLLISGGNYSLEPVGEYFDNFHWNNGELSNELIFSIRNDRGSPVGSAANRYYMTLHYNQNPSGWNGFTTLADFYNSFDAVDERRGGKAVPGLTDSTGLRNGFLIGQQFDGKGNKLKDRGGNDLVFTPDINILYSNERQGIRVLKYLPDPTVRDKTQSGNDYVFFRYADVLLMKAEAILRGGTATNGATAVSLVNTVRAARGVAALGSVDETSLIAERGREFYWEGWRRNDLVRFGQFTRAFGQKDEVSPEHVVVFAIPQRALDTNPNLKQNFGY